MQQQFPAGMQLKRDVFIVFSKSEPMEARFALAVRGGLEELGLSAFEYEDWSWVEQGVDARDGEVEVDRTRLRSMLQESLAVMVIPPPGGRPSAGVATELDLLAEMKAPALVLRWSYPHEPFERDDINVIYTYQIHGSNPGDRWISGAASQLAELLWVAGTTSRLRNQFAPAGSLLLDQMPAFGIDPLTSFKLRDGLVQEGDYLREPDRDAVAALVVDTAAPGQMEALIDGWWAEAEPTLRYLADDGHGPVKSPCAALRDVMEAVAERARERFPALNQYSADALQRRGIALTRHGDFDGAVTALTDALAHAVRCRDRIYTARAIAYMEQEDLELALADMDAAVECAANGPEESVHRFTRAIYQAMRKTPEGHRAAIADYSRILKLSPEPGMQLRALNYRAMEYTRLGEIDAALADWETVIVRHTDQPRAAAQARLNRAGTLIRLGKLSEARDDLTSLLEWADVSGNQRFRALQARADVLERLGEFAAAADDLEQLLNMDMADPEWRPELKEKIRQLRLGKRAAGRGSAV